MPQKCRKFTAAFLSSVLVLLSVAGELAHHHEAPDTGLHAQQTQKAGAAAQVKQGHNQLCVACLFASAHVAVAASPQLFMAQHGDFVSLPTVFVFNCSTAVLPNGLRAPPASLV